MPKVLDEVTKDALDLPLDQRLTLAGLLLESTDTGEGETDSAWESEIGDRLQAVQEGRVVGLAYEDVMQEAKRRLVL
jgi:putative addiction module component (TIGR02574 family)